MKSLYFDCINGISGDMTLGAFLDLGVPLSYLKKELKKLPLTSYSITKTKTKRCSIEGTKVNIKIKESHHHRTYTDIVSLINKSTLSKSVKNQSIEIFKTLAVAEGRVHGINFKSVHFHEVGAVDSIIDIVGTAICLDYMKIDKVYSSSIPLGGGTVKCAHGTMPIPAPATLKMITGFEIKKSTLESELTTPTGAAIVATLTKKSTALPDMTITGSGIGIGSKDFKGIPNITRIIVGTDSTAVKKNTNPPNNEEPVIQIESNIDDSTPEVMGYLIEKLLKNKAIDAFVIPITMKKNRPAFLLTVLTTEKLKDKLTAIIFNESSTIGLRWFPANRECLDRELVKVVTKYGPINIKISYKDGNIVNIAPEFEDCSKIAKKTGIAIKTVLDLAITSYNKAK